MSKVFYVDRYNGSILSKALLADNVLLEFAFGGRFVREGAIDYSIPVMTEVDVVSVLKSGGGTEIATCIDGVLNTCVIDASIMQVTSTLRNINGLLFMGTRPGTVEGIAYTQYIFAYSKNMISNARIMEVVHNG